MKVDVSNQYSTSADVVPSQHSILSNGFFGESENLQIDLTSMAMPLSPLSPKSNIVRSRITRARHGSILSLPSRMRSPDLIDQFFSTRQSRAPITLVDQAARKRSISRTRKMSISLRKLGSFMMSGNVSDGPDGRLQRIFHSLLCSLWWTIILTVCTLSSIYLDNIRLACLPKSADTAVYGIHLCTLIVFVLDLCMYLGCVPEYRRSVYPWLDILAIISLIPEIPWLCEILHLDSSPDFGDVRSSHGARFISRSAQILRTVRILRLMSIPTRRSITVGPLSRAYSPESQGGDSKGRRSSNSS
eukprot:231287_1